MAEQEQGPIGIPELVEQLRVELDDAREAARKRGAAFDVTEIELELKVGVKRVQKAGGKLGFSVIALGGMKGEDRESVQTVRLTLQPKKDLSMGNLDRESA
ncbi:MAG: trypco2 family protein [Acidobacteriota bacterium]